MDLESTDLCLESMAQEEVWIRPNTIKESSFQACYSQGKTVPVYIKSSTMEPLSIERGSRV